MTLCLLAEPTPHTHCHNPKHDKTKTRFGKDEVLRFTFNLADVDMSGTVTFDEFLVLLQSLHPYNYAQAKQTLDRLDLDPQHGISFETFLAIHQKYVNNNCL